jgi:hypothetical protein
MGTSINVRDLPYLTHVPVDGRIVPIVNYYDVTAKRFFTYIPISTDANELWVLPPDAVVEGIYFSGEPADDQDSRLPFLETVLQHLSFPEVISAVWNAQADLVNGLASLHKYFVLLDYASVHKDNSYMGMMRTEIEYAFTNHRAFYDCLHRIIKTIHERFQPRASELPRLSFHDVAKKDETVLALTHLLPQSLIDFYKGHEKKFKLLRDIRGEVIHSGYTPGKTGIYLLPREGFAISVDSRLAKRLGDFNLWPSNLLKDNRLGSVLAILEFLVSDMFNAMREAGIAFVNYFAKFPPRPIAARCELFLRSPLARHLVSLDKYRERHWFDPKDALGITEAN